MSEPSANYNYDSIVAEMKEKNHGLATGLMLLICLMEHPLAAVDRILESDIFQQRHLGNDRRVKYFCRIQINIRPTFLRSKLYRVFTI
ncbi:TPA: hypothetical protein ACFK6Y_07455 [Neisseria gonorrhoeae]|uniref:Uncharacterized protein n=2 Tax=Neisseria gonorrhoeae TaxID=485 RepID=A0AAX2TRU8_NEIGO|nr:hypothetical protein EGH15_11890 [Neisseria gonorrhoeae]EEZ52140.1 conserved hypothetical protein [Neisseria gonorrhoeae PID1]EEZ54496.1 conserved hypothetical protein [Neisseria gonorrhoeae PID332]EFF39325.1 conserved hypothetical protein [Neisseria gonorrhoeae F62]KMW64323.1 hypothetical protein NGCG_00070 [Neisseria gonorrhoeae DGI18]KMY06818.1 hypothetical protein NGIG_02067 [Neisseria gonorrhoeae PID24-1]